MIQLHSQCSPLQDNANKSDTESQVKVDQAGRGQDSNLATSDRKHFSSGAARSH
jgi:hypothetical protein